MSWVSDIQQFLPWLVTLPQTPKAIASLVILLVAMFLLVVMWSAPQTGSSTTGVSPSFSDPPRVTEQNSWKIFESWVKHHPEIIRDYGKPRDVKFVSVHDQPFTKGFVAYNVTDSWSVWLFEDSHKFTKLNNPLRPLTPGSGREIDERLFSEISDGMDASQRTFYRSLVNSRIESPDFNGVGIIGGIALLYIKSRFYEQLGSPRDNEFLTIDAIYASADGYELLAGLRHEVGGTSPTSPKSVYVLLRDGGYVRHEEFPVPYR